MKVYIYSSSGHAFGLENVRRCSAIYKQLEEFNPTLATADYRAATFAKSELGVKVGLGVDVIGNLPHMMEKGDILVYDSDEPSETMTSYMKEYCTLLYKVGSEIPANIVDQDFFNHEEIKREKAFFFADDDYANEILRLCENQESQDLAILWGHYFFFKNEDAIAKAFAEVIEEEDYIETVKTTRYLLTSTVHSVLESLAAGNKPVFYKRCDKDTQNEDLIAKYNVPVVTGSTMSEINDNFNKVCENYPEVKQIENVSLENIKDEIAPILEKFKHIYAALDYK
ncbi:MAG: hypothetical protein HN901_02670 [Campylobacteraceae bacterium]|nr:hypothetical protein [Campylobacteraceae bacterium]